MAISLSDLQTANSSGGKKIGSTIDERLKAQGIPDEDRARIAEDLKNLDSQVSEEDIQKQTTNANTTIQDKGSEMSKTACGKATITAYQVTQAQQVAKSKASSVSLTNGHSHQDLKSPIVFNDPPTNHTKYTTVKPMKPVSSSFGDNYSKSTGHISPGNNWTRQDNQEKTIEKAHGNSGSFFKIDNEGNVTVHISGNLRVLIDGDTTISILKSLDIGTDKSISLDSKEKMSIRVTDLLDIVSKGFDLNSSDIVSSKSRGDTTVTSSASASYKSSGATTIRGSRIDLN